MSKYSKTIVNQICVLIEKDSYTIPEICSIVGISEATYHKWKLEKLEFSEAIKEASDKFDALLVSEAKKSLMKQIKGYTVIEQKVIKNGTGKIIERTNTKKHFQPNTTAIIFTLVNRDSDNWKNRQNTEHSGEITINKISKEEREKRIKELTEKLNR